MNCPSGDKLSQYVDELLDKSEHQEIKMHVLHCEKCQHIIQLFEGEIQFIKETLATPALPEDFDEQVLAKVQPYKKRPTLIRKGMATAAAAVLSVGLLAAVSPSFANFVLDIFSSEQVDPGLNEAQKLGFVEQVHYEQTSKGITIHIDEVMVDTKRIALVVHATNKRGKLINHPIFGKWGESQNMEFTKENGEPITEFSFGAGYKSEKTFAVLQIDTPKLTEDLRLHWKIDEVNGKKGDWQFEIPIPIEKALPDLKTVDLHQTITAHNIAFTMEQATFTPSTAALNYRLKLVEPLPKDSRIGMSPGLSAAYMIEDGQGNVLAANSVYRDYIHDEERSTPQLSGAGGGEEASGWEWEDVFSTISDDSPVLQLAGFEVPVYINKSITFTPSALHASRLMLHEDYPIQILAMEKMTASDSDEPRFELKLQYDKDVPLKMDSASWYLADDSGTDYFIDGYYNTRINGHYETTLTISRDMDLQKTYTLTLLTATMFEQLDEPISIPLTK